MTATDPAVQAVAEALDLGQRWCCIKDMAEAAVAAARPAIEAQALRDAADIWRAAQNHRPADAEPCMVEQWLCDRADQIEAD